jgi:RNA polymerase sigma-70 factor (ECF subfamily)
MPQLVRRHASRSGCLATSDSATSPQPRPRPGVRQRRDDLAPVVEIVGTKPKRNGDRDPYPGRPRFDRLACMWTDQDARRPHSSVPAEVDGPVTRLPARTSWRVGSYDASGDPATVGGADVAGLPGLRRFEIGYYRGADADHRLRVGPTTTSALDAPDHSGAHVIVEASLEDEHSPPHKAGACRVETGVVSRRARPGPHRVRLPNSTASSADRFKLVTIPSDVSASRRRSVAGRANGRIGHTIARRTLDADSRSWLQRLHAPEPIRGQAIEDLYERLRREAAFHVRQRVASLAGFPRSDIDDLATQAAGDALIALLRKLEDYRGDSHFLTWARRFAALEAPASIRRRLGRDRIGISRDPERADDVADRGQSAQSRAELHELLEKVGQIMRDELTSRQRTVLTEVAINGASAAVLAEQLDTTPGAVYKSLHDARSKVRRLTTQLAPIG